MSTRQRQLTRSRIGCLIAAGACLIAVTAPGASASIKPDNTVGTLWGAVVKKEGKETFQQALARSESKYGTLGVIRWFGGDKIPAWSDINARLGAHPSILSFNLPLPAVMAGTYDAALTSWFNQMPTTHKIWFSFYHEPDVAVAHNVFTPAQYVAAYKHVADIAHAANKPNLELTLTLTCYTPRPNAHRNWLDYYAGASYVDVVSWDCYNHGTGPNGYGYPVNLFKYAVEATQSVGQRFAVAEVGSVKRPADTSGALRAQWITDASRYLDPLNPVFVSYFDTNAAGTDYRLTDAPSIAAWHAVVSDQNPMN